MKQRRIVKLEYCRDGKSLDARPLRQIRFTWILLELDIPWLSTRLKQLEYSWLKGLLVVALASWVGRLHSNSELDEIPPLQ